MWHNIVAALRIIILTSACPGKIEIQGLSVTCNRGLWVSPGTPVSSTNKTDSHEITEILLKVALNTIDLKNQIYKSKSFLTPVCLQSKVSGCTYSKLKNKYILYSDHLLHNVYENFFFLKNPANDDNIKTIFTV
jgi:hypothetical protein